ncbi:RusA family crossover junction endodeoxyribonuclease [Dongshaea marina]|uniref:RusA family crossover junction endodeoxyribonuclease n=1 Tax=Dongshaea marina TaxID=2047966 RepID=UPI000D3E0B16|nr:RusA family crossover junction endodeoxyribonuclease [Dongshaea marina]
MPHEKLPLTIKFDFPPSVNKHHKPTVQNGKLRIRKGDEARRFQKRAEVSIWEAGAYNARISDLVDVELVLCPATKRRYDSDNFSKAVLDALVQCGAIKDDSQVQSIRSIKGPIIKGGRSYLRITPHTEGLPAWFADKNTRPQSHAMSRYGRAHRSKNISI